MSTPHPDHAELRADAAAAIRLAFADDATPPSPPRIRSDLTDGFYRSVEARFQQLVEHPTGEALIEHTHLSSALQPAAERWFWRTHLLAVLDAPWDPRLDYQTRSMVHSATYGLRPNPCAVRAGRTDYDDAQNLRERLTEDQRQAVGRFLGVVLAFPMPGPSPHAYLASQAVAWCWSDDPAATEAARTLRARARSYRRPTADFGGHEDLVRAVARAFEETPVPSGPLMSGTSEEPSEYAIELRGTRWQDLAPWFLDLHATAFCYMTDAAFRYFLPAALCHELGPGSEVSLDFHLIDEVLEPTSAPEQVHARILSFSDDERAVVADVLQRTLGHGELLEERLRTAVVDFWDPDTGLQA